jgi:hypothetical protein
MSEKFKPKTTKERLSYHTCYSGIAQRRERKLFGIIPLSPKITVECCKGLVQAKAIDVACACPLCPNREHRQVVHLCEKCGQTHSTELFSDKIKSEDINKRLRKLWENNKNVDQL